MINPVRIKVEAPKLPAREGMISYPVSYDYNSPRFVQGTGLIYGYDVADPIIPAGYELVEMYFGLQLNSYPPMKKNMLRKIK
jgi:hypothetical protein